MAVWKWKLATLLLVAGALMAAPFESPREGPVAFRRDRVPLDVDTMTELSGELVVLAQGHPQATAPDRRTLAQMLALSLAMNPANREAREALVLMKKGRSLRVPEKPDLERSRSIIWHILSWLETPEAGPDAAALAACLADVIAVADREHPRAKPLFDRGERGAWKDWIPDLSAYQEAELAKVEPVKDSNSLRDGTPAPTEAKLLLPSATVSTPLWSVHKTSKVETLGILPVRMTATVTPPILGTNPPIFSVDFTLDSQPLVRINRTLSRALGKQFGAFPSGFQANLNLGDEVPYLPVRDRDAISGAAAVLLSAALSGREPAGMVIGRIDEAGAFKAVPDLWDRLRAVSKGPGGRLVIPAEAADLLPSILALEDPEFFMKYDVLTAASLGELLDRSAKTPASPLTESLAKFNDVRTKGTSQPIGQYVANRFVRQRLVDLAAELPYFASPKMLAIQAAGERPVRVPRKIIACELKRALLPISWLPTKTNLEMDLVQLDAGYEACRAEIDRLERYVDSRDRDFLIQVRDMSTTLRAYSRAARVGINRENGLQNVTAAFDAMKKSYAATMKDLLVAAGDTEIPPP